jgi:hypothetical protein
MSRIRLNPTIVVRRALEQAYWRQCRDSLASMQLIGCRQYCGRSQQSGLETAGAKSAVISPNHAIHEDF